MQLKHLDCVAVHNQTKSFLKEHFLCLCFHDAIFMQHLVKFKTAINATQKIISPQYLLQMQLHIKLD